MLTNKLEEVVKIWPSIAPIFSVPHTEEEYDRLVALLDELLTIVGEDENHPLASLIDTLGILTEAYEATNYPEPEGNPLEALRFLMEEHGFQESDLPEIGSREEMSLILAGERELDTRQIRALCKKFHVNPAVFLKD